MTRVTRPGFMATIALAPLALALQGCTALLIGGAAAGGYVVGKDDRPVGQMVDDGTITASVKSKLIADKYVPASRINVDTYQGQVTLTGTVETYIARTQAEKLAGDVNGVTKVINNLVVQEKKGNGS